MLRLISGNVTYEEAYPEEGVAENDRTVFVLRKLSAKQVNEIDDQVTKVTQPKGSAKNDATVQVLGGTARRLKIEAGLVDWRNMQDEDGTEAACNSANKEKLPAEVQAWLEEKIDGANRLKGMEETEIKNS